MTCTSKEENAKVAIHVSDHPPAQKVVFHKPLLKSCIPSYNFFFSQSTNLISWCTHVQACVRRTTYLQSHKDKTIVGFLYVYSKSQKFNSSHIAEKVHTIMACPHQSPVGNPATLCHNISSRNFQEHFIYGRMPRGVDHFTCVWLFRQLSDVAHFACT